jgi:hypothetical protein
MKAFKTVVDKRTNHDGFKMTFANGNTISVMFGPYTYSDSGETTAEVAAWNEEGYWMLFQDGKWIVVETGNEIMPRQTPEQVAEMMNELRKF